MIVQLRAVPGCPNVDATRAVLSACLVDLGLPPQFDDVVGDYPSPSVLVDGVDVAGADPHAPAACVLTPPTAAQIRSALLRAAEQAGSDPL